MIKTWKGRILLGVVVLVGAVQVLGAIFDMSLYVAPLVAIPVYYFRKLKRKITK